MQTETRSIHTFQEGELFDNRYRLVKRAGSGGFADVWRAVDTLRKNKVVALKIYTRLDEEDIKEMSDEYDKTEDLQHPNLLTGNHFAAVGNIPYLEMRYCDGGSLASRVGRMGNDELRHMLRDVCSGLAYLHAEGIVHQDIKPENILLDTKHDRYMLADFGISGKSRSRLSKSAKMASDFVAMTAAYAPPEKLSANPIDRTPSTKGDIFSLGVTLYELATGNLPVDLPQSTGQLLLISQGRQPLYFDNIADPQLRQIVEHCMSYRKDDRPTAEAVLDMLDGKTTESELKQEPSQESSHEKLPTEKIKQSGCIKQTVILSQSAESTKSNHITNSNRKWVYLTVAIADVLLIFFLIKPSMQKETLTTVDMDTSGIQTTDERKGVTKNGLYYEFEKDNPDGQQVHEGDVLYGEMTVSLDTIILFSTNGEGQRIAQAVPNFEIKIGEGLLMMHVGDIAIFTVDADSVARYVDIDAMPPAYCPGTQQKIIYRIDLQDIVTKEEIEEEIEEWKAEQK